MQVRRCMTKFLGLHDKLLRDEVDIVKFGEKYYLFGIKSEANPKDENPYFCVILDNTVNLGQKVRNRRVLFFRDHCILRTKSALPGTILSDGFFFRDQCILSTKSALPGNNFKFFFREISKNVGRKLVLITMTLRLKVTISHKIFFLPIKYCMSHSLITHNIPIFMTRVWHANCMARLRGHRTPL